jgi:signal peptidase
VSGAHAAPRVRDRRAFAINLALWAITIIIVAVLWPARFGGNLGVTVVSGQSMEPTYVTGDLVITWRSSDYAIGDIVVYSPPNSDFGRLRVVHRIIDQYPDGRFTLQGDNNPSPDPWFPTSDDIEGRAVLHIPSAGNILVTLLSPLFLALIAAVLIGFTVYSLIMNWETNDPGPDDESHDDTAADHTDGQRPLPTAPPQ